MRCPSCNKFVPYDTDVESEEESQEIDETCFIATYRRVLTCAECGEELKEATIEVDHDFSGVVTGGSSDENHEHVFEIESCDVSSTIGAVTKDRHGRQIKNSRYMATLYGVECDVEVKCECGATANFTCEADERASSFDELV